LRRSFNRRQFVLLALIVSIMAIGFFIVARSLTWRHVRIPPIEPRGGQSLNAAELFPLTSSRLVLTARVPFGEIRALAQKQIPPSIGGVISLPDQGGLSGISIRPSLAVDPLKLDPIVGSVPAKVSLGTGVHGRVNAKAFKWIVVNILGSKIKTKSPDLSADVDLTAHIDGWVSPGIDQNWLLTHQEKIDVHVDRASGSTLFGIIHFDPGQQLQDGVNRAAPGTIKGALDSLAARLPLRQEVEKVWNELCKPIKVADRPSAYAVLQPSQVCLQQIAFDDPNTFTIRLALDAKCLTTIAESPPAATTAPPLPPPVQQRVIDPEFQVVIPIALAPSEADKLIQAPQGWPIALNVDANSTVDIRGLSLCSKAGVIYVKASIHGANKSLHATADGDLFLQAKPVYDESSQQLRFEQVDFDLETKDVVAKVAAWLLNDRICKSIQDSVRLDVAQVTAQAKESANSRFSSVEVVPGIRLNSKLDKLKFTGIEARDDLLIFGFTLSGQMACDVTANAPTP
jgi:hypothetical protein